MDIQKTPNQKTIKLEALVSEKLIIPPYQRPYKWTKKNVVQLLEDIFEYVVVKKKDYRIGNIILYEKDGEKNIVDGQQRLTTISLLLKKLDLEFNGLLSNQEFKLNISKNNIVYNFRVLEKWLDTKFKEAEKKEFKEQILKKCEFVLFTVYNEDEAFQLFDSQNARGKELEPFDLLKAFHLREMEFDTEEERTKCVERWENSIDENKLKPILGNHLFKIRKWSKNEWKYDFTKRDIDEFKGVSLHHKQQYPYESALRMLDGFVDNAQNDKFLRNLHIAQSFPFSITMPINDYTKRVFDIAKERFNKNKDKLSYPEINIFNLYYIDFLLWKLYKDEIQGLENFFAANENADNIDMLKYKIFKKRNLFNDFKFRQISSREHLLSQEHAKRDKIDKTIYNSIGNLCLISISQNSKGNKESPDEKKKLFLDDNYSLKRIIMFESFDENGKWRPEQIQKHEKDILLLIEYYK